MKTLEIYFKSATLLAVSCWLLLILFPSFSYSNQYVILVAVALLAVSYGYLLFFRKNHDATIYPKGNFSTLQGVSNLFLNPKGVLIGWIHYLAFDLMVGLYIKQEATTLGMSHWLQIPCFILTLVFGPLGLLLFFILRFTLFQNL
jgi:Domain of unknown function (DUF4281)